MYKFLELYMVPVDIAAHFLHEYSIFIKLESNGVESYNLARHLIAAIWFKYDMLYETSFHVCNINFL